MLERSIPIQRRNDILAQLEQNRFVRSSTLSRLLNASEATIRRDLAILEEEGLIERTHGGAMVSHRMQAEPAFSASKQNRLPEKEHIGAAAAQMVRSGETIFLNFGTTTTQVARFLKQRDDLQDVTVVTNNISVLQELQSNPAFQIICLGGYYRTHSQSFVGTMTVRAMEGILAGQAFIGVDGVSPRYGCTTPVESDAEISRQMIENTTGNVVLVADSSKWGVVSKFRVAPLQRIGRWITDAGLPGEANEILEGAPVEIVLAGG
ncbi:MAG: DeoR/GlpR transcriptional regulator [Chloroflexi bacterium]|nr:DeoR/GlpR family DNA-binding transcription regulator [Anaerolineaceae bacterium]NMB88927.1 DeoR/GlpR transcriptional regulator [Chloroflexota bacterium]